MTWHTSQTIALAMDLPKLNWLVMEQKLLWIESFQMVMVMVMCYSRVRGGLMLMFFCSMGGWERQLNEYVHEDGSTYAGVL